MNNNQETKVTCIDKAQEFCKISDSDRKILTHLFPNTMRAIDDVKKVHPEAFIKTVIVTDDSDSVDSMDAMTRSTISAVCNNVSSEFVKLVNTNADETYCNLISMPTAIKCALDNIDNVLFDDAIVNRSRSAVLSVGMDTCDTRIMAFEFCVAAYVSRRIIDSINTNGVSGIDECTRDDIEDDDTDVATAIYTALVNLDGLFMNHTVKKNMPQTRIGDMLASRAIVAHNQQLPQGLFDNRYITMSSLRANLDDIAEHFGTVILADSDGIDPQDFNASASFACCEYMTRQFLNQTEPLEINHLLMRGDAAAIAFQYVEIEGNKKRTRTLKTGIVFNCDHPDIANALVETSEVWYTIKSNIDAEIDELSHGDICWQFGWDYPYECRLWDYLLDKEKINPACTAIPITTPMLNNYIEYAINNALESLNKYAEERNKKENKTE